MNKLKNEQIKLHVSTILFYFCANIILIRPVSKISFI